VCTVVVLIRPGHAWPVTIAANRDERLDRAWDPPAAYWPDYPGVVGGRDRTAGGTWMALSRHGVVAAVLNRPGTLGPLAGKRSRGDLPLLAVAQPTAQAAGEAIAKLDGTLWRGFNLVIADAAGAVFVRGIGQGHPDVQALTPGLHMITAHDPNDLASARIEQHLPAFQAAAAPEPGDWKSWPALLANRSGDGQRQLNIDPRGGFGTVCSSLVALPAGGQPIWLFAAGRPDEAPYRPV
jgi:hypothetical protein